MSKPIDEKVKVQLLPMERSFLSGEIVKRSIKDTNEEIYTFKISSDDPAEMWAGIHETLGHKKGEVRMDWFKSGNAPLLWMHDRERQIGVIVDANLSKKSMSVSVKFGTNEKALEVKRDVDAGVIKNVSIGYNVNSYEQVEGTEFKEHYRATDWEGLEASFVSIPADRTVGVGRSAPSPRQILSKTTEKPIQEKSQPIIKVMEPTAEELAAKQKELDAQLRQSADDAVKADRQRQASIREAAEKTKGYDLKDIAQRSINEGDSVDQFNAKALELIRSSAPAMTQEGIGVDKKDQKQYNVMNVVEGLINGDLHKRAGFELEVSEALNAQSNNGRSVSIPQDVIVQNMLVNSPRTAAAFGISQRDLQSVTLSGDGESNTISNIVDTELMTELFAYSLREDNTLLEKVHILAGLVGDAEIPLELLNPEFYWIGEDEEPTLGNYGLGKVGLNFKTLAARVAFTRRAEKQSLPGIQNLLIQSMRKGLSLALERSFYTGAGSTTEPEGILNTAGVGAVISGGVHSRNALIDLRKAIGVANASKGGSQLFMSEHTAAEFAKTPISTDSDRFVADYMGDENKALTSIGTANLSNLIPNTQSIDPSTGLPSATSSVLYGDPSSLLVGVWGTMELDIDDTTQRNTGGKDLRVFMDADTVIPQPAHWAVITDLP